MGKLIAPEILGINAYDSGPLGLKWLNSPYREVYIFCRGALSKVFNRNYLTEEAIAVCIKLGL